MRLYFISDLHLKNENEIVAKYFCNFLNNVPRQGDVLVLGGDIFDLFIGNKEIFKIQFPQLISALRSVASRGCVVHYLEGNHDFHLQGVFSKEVNVHAGELSLALGDKKILFSHGDEIDKEDYGYRFLRFFTRSFIGVFLIRVLPDAIFSMIGNWSSKTSRQYNNLEKLSTNRQQRTRSLFKVYADQKHAEGYQYVFVGHSHLADFTGSYVNLGFSNKELLFAFWDSSASSITLQSWQTL